MIRVVKFPVPEVKVLQLIPWGAILSILFLKGECSHSIPETGECAFSIPDRGTFSILFLAGERSFSIPDGMFSILFLAGKRSPSYS
jgi:hypothetical protein